ncbi:MAG: MBL fold metallo-hydrolase RNA specificity domain-containing protein [Clostridia bacterium]
MGCKSRFHVDIMDIHDKVTGSCHLCVTTFPNEDRLKFVVDCGLFQQDDGEEYNKKFPFKANDIDFCIVTHNHVDHTGRLPLLVKEGFGGKIYATETTCNLLPEALNDSYSVLKNNAKINGNFPIYGEEDVSHAINLCTPCNYYETIQINENVKVNFFENAHLPGAAIILVRISFPEYEDINLIFTGDYNNKSVFQNDVHIPQWVLDLPVTVIQESTYGDTNSSEIEPCFDRNILKAIKEGWTVLAPVFSLGRTQEILYRLKCLQNSGQLDVSIPVYLDGKLAIRYTNMYLKGLVGIREEMQDFLPENFIFVDKIIRNNLLHEDNSCKIILTSSGMGSYGPARSYIPAYLGRQKMLIHFTGYTAVGTMGRKIKDTPAGEIVNVAGLLIKKRAKVEYTSEFSAHAKADTMIDFLKQFSNLKLVLVNHGEPEVKDKFATRILNEVDSKNVGVLNRDTLFRVNSWGLVKTIPTKFI